MNYYEIMLEALQDMVDVGELTVEDAEVLNDLAYDRYMEESYSDNVTYESYLDALEDELLEETGSAADLYSYAVSGQKDTIGRSKKNIAATKKELERERKIAMQRASKYDKTDAGISKAYQQTKSKNPLLRKLGKKTLHSNVVNRAKASESFDRHYNKADQLEDKYNGMMNTKERLSDIDRKRLQKLAGRGWAASQK